MSALFKPDRRSAPSEDWKKIAQRTSLPVERRLCAGIYLSYHAATGAKEADTFQRDAKTWAVFEHSVLPEVEKFTFFDRSRETYVAPAAVLADGMFHLWTVTELGLDSDGRPTTIAVITELAAYLCTLYEATRIDSRAPRRNWLGLSPSQR